MPPDPNVSLRFQLFGPFAVQVNGAPLPRLRSRKVQALLALLALRAGTAVERACLAALLWPESLESRALATLRGDLVSLRHALGPAADRLRSPTPRSLCLELAEGEADLLTFDAAVRRGDLASLDEAVTLYRGPLLEGCAEPWAFAERQAREQAYLSARERLAAIALEQGDASEAERHLRLAIAADPLRESTQRVLMQALAAAGNFAAALLCYRELRLLLHRELNAEPDPETKVLFQRLRAEARGLAARPAARSRMLLASPSPALSGDLPPPRSRETLRNNLPLPLTSFIGREDQIAQIQERLAAHRLVTLTGAGGCGKTRLALEVAGQLVGEGEVLGAGGVWLVELASLTDPALVPQRVAAALGLREQPGRALTQTLVDALKPQRLVLLLDNCEHLLPACAELAETLLRACPGLRLLTTSREPLGVPGEVLYRVPSLSLPKEGVRYSVLGIRSDSLTPNTEHRTPEHLTQYEAIRLFAERAAAAFPGFAITPENAALVAQICVRLDGIPLAIELAAARVRALPIETLAARLDDRFRLLTGARSAPPRHQTLRALIDWSYDLLSEAERALLRRLSVFAGGWTLEAAEAVCAGPGLAEGEILDRLTTLVEKSLVQYEAPEGKGRYRLLETVRRYSRDRLVAGGGESSRPVLAPVGRAGTRAAGDGPRRGPRDEAGGDEGAIVRGRHLDYFLALAEEAKANGSEQGCWLDEVHAEQDNLRAALTWCTGSDAETFRPGDASAGGCPTGTSERPTPAESGLRLAAALEQFWLARGLLGEGREWLARSLRASDAPAALRARALNSAAWLACMQGDRVAARPLYENSLALLREIDDRKEITATLAGLAFIAAGEGDLERARELNEERLVLGRAGGDWGCVAGALGDLGELAARQGDLEAARSLHEESLVLLRENGRPPQIALTLVRLGEVAEYQGELQVAQSRTEEALALYQRLNHRHGMAGSLDRLGELNRLQGDAETAYSLAAASLVLFRELGVRQAIAGGLASLGRAALDRGDPESARTHFEEGLAINRELGSKPGTRECLEGLAWIATAQGCPERAAWLFGATHAMGPGTDRPLSLHRKRERDARLAAVRRALSEATFAAAWRAGQAVDGDQAFILTVALADGDPG